MESYRCVVCQEEITSNENSYSTRFFKMPLCRKHQKIQKLAQERQAKSEQKTKLKEEPEVVSNIINQPEETPIQKASTPTKSEDSLIQWLIQWAAARPINLSLESKHFFAEGMRLEELARDAIGKAEEEILVTSPFVDSCFLATALQDARDRRVDVKIISRRPKKDKDDLAKLECHAALRKKGVTIHYVNTIHSKIIIIDRKIVILSSMNLYSGSTGGGLLEAGIVSFESKVVDSATKYITDLLAKTESPDITSFSNPNYRRRY
jgi:phosphatidylserine/phosphatidylglycerophosphate/cardiolipin synthase-like enzyme